MIAIESFKKFRTKDLMVIIIFSGLYWAITSLTNSSYILPLAIAIFLMSFIVHLVRRAGSATLFFTIAGLITSNINEFGVVGIDKLIVFVVAGLVFEVVFLILKVEMKNIQIDIILGSALAGASVPLVIGFVLGSNFTSDMLSLLLNLILVSFFIGVISSVISFIVWYKLRTTKFVLKYEYE